MEKPGGNMRPKAVAILSTGEMGHAIAGVLGENGLRVLTVLQGRSQRTRDLAAKSGVSDLPTMEELVAASDIVLSVVVPSAAPSVASAIAAAVNKTGKPVLYVDLNAISPMTSTAIGEVLSAAAGRYVDGCIIGASSKLKRELCITPFFLLDHSSMTSLETFRTRRPHRIFRVSDP